MAVDLMRPDLEMRLRLDPYAPRAARYQVAQVDRPSPDLRDAVTLLTSELVTSAVQHCRSERAVVELRVWMPADVVRVELRAPRHDLGPPFEGEARHYSLLLLDELADRWSYEEADGQACMWFEIDRHVRESAAGGGAGVRVPAKSLAG
ncbi:MAG TPA: ATP-binding protein [Solirubrobacteraceae bacterium]|nr:ATP-binding protein [Solirubrobacteraceae bacterium]